MFIHGLFVNSSVWDDLVPLLAGRCILPDLPLGAHRLPMNGADLSPPGLAKIIAEFIERLELSDVTVIGNDTGGALCQILCANHPEVVDRLEKGGYLKRQPNPRDRRSVLVHLNPTKVKKMQAFYGEINQRMAALLDETPERELRSVVNLLSKMNASRVEEPPSQRRQ